MKREGGPLPWLKLRDDWFTARAHVNLSSLALHFGPRLMSLANASPVRGALLDAAGAPITDAALAREARVSIQAVRAALAELLACGALAQRAGGGLEFPEFTRWQERGSAQRMRAHRARHEVRHSDAQGDREVTGEVKSSRSSPVVPTAQVEGDEGPPSAPLPPSAPPLVLIPAEPSPPTKAELEGDAIRRVIRHHATHHPAKRSTPSEGSNEWKKIKARLSEGHTVEVLCAAIDGAHRDRWHRETGNTGLAYIMRDDSTVTRLAQAGAPARYESPLKALELERQRLAREASAAEGPR